MEAYGLSSMTNTEAWGFCKQWLTNSKIGLIVEPDNIEKYWKKHSATK